MGAGAISGHTGRRHPVVPVPIIDVIVALVFAFGILYAMRSAYLVGGRVPSHVLVREPE